MGAVQVLVTFIAVAVPGAQPRWGQGGSPQAGANSVAYLMLLADSANMSQEAAPGRGYRIIPLGVATARLPGGAEVRLELHARLAPGAGALVAATAAAGDINELLRLTSALTSGGAELSGAGAGPLTGSVYDFLGQVLGAPVVDRWAVASVVDDSGAYESVDAFVSAHAKELAAFLLGADSPDHVRDDTARSLLLRPLAKDRASAFYMRALRGLHVALVGAPSGWTAWQALADYAAYLSPLELAALHSAAGRRLSELTEGLSERYAAVVRVAVSMRQLYSEQPQVAQQPAGSAGAERGAAVAPAPRPGPAVPPALIVGSVLLLFLVVIALGIVTGSPALVKEAIPLLLGVVAVAVAVLLAQAARGIRGARGG